MSFASHSQEFVSVREVVERQRQNEQKKVDADLKEAHRAEGRASMAHMPNSLESADVAKMSAAEKASRRRSTANINPAAMSEFHRSRAAAMNKNQVPGVGEISKASPEITRTHSRSGLGAAPVPTAQP